MSTTTSSFQIYPDYFNTIEECKDFEKNYNKQQSNVRYKNFKQIHFTAGDEEQFNTHRHSKNHKEKDILITDKNLFYKSKSLFEEWNKYKNIETENVLNTFKYIFYKFKKGIFIKIVDNQLKVFLPFSNVNFINEWSDNIQIDPKYEDIVDYLKHISKLENKTFHEYNVNKYKNTWYGNNCLVRYEYPINEGDTNVSSLKNMLEELCSKREIPNIEFFINRRDFPLLNRNGFEPYYHLWDSKEKSLVSHNYDKYLPILSMSGNNNFADILIPTYEDWIRVQNYENKWFPKERQNYRDNIFNKPWKYKKPTAVFRGSSTGEGTTKETNQRINIAFISSITAKDEDGILYIDAGITKWNVRPKKLINNPYLQNIDVENLPFETVQRLSPLEQSEYKYIIHIDGHVSALRLSYELSMNSVILKVDSPWKCWYSDMLIPYEHYIPIKDDASDLLEKIKWCRNNDKKCEIIAKNGLEFYNKYLRKDGILDYFQKLFIDLKKDIGIYYYNEISNIEIQNKEQSNYFEKSNLKFPTTRKNINNINLIPKIERCYSLLKGLHFIVNMIIIKSNFEEEAKEIELIFNNKLGSISRTEIAGFKFIIKSTKDKNKSIEHIHEAYIGLNCINNIIKYIPNYAYIFGLYRTESDNKVNIISEFISNETLQSYIIGKNFNFNVLLNIILQICLALEVAQEKCNFVHYDLTPWNILLKHLKEDVYVEYHFNNKVIKIKTNIIPVIIDYGKSHVSHNNIHYGIVNMYKFDKSFDILSIFITVVYQIIISQKLSSYDFKNFIILSNFISGTLYCNNRFKNSKDIKTFFHHAKKYTNLINDNKYELKNITPIDLFDYIYTNLSQYYHFNIEYNNIYSSFMNKGNAKQVFDYILSNTNKDKINSFVNAFRDIKKISFFSQSNKVLNIYLLQTLENEAKTMFQYMLEFLKKECVSNIYMYKDIYEDTLNYLNNIYKNIIEDNNYIIDEDYDYDYDYSDLTLSDFNENIFLKVKEIKNIVNKIKIIESKYNIEIINRKINNSTIVNNILVYNGSFKNTQFEIKFKNTSCIINTITNICTLKKMVLIIYNENIKNEDKDIDYIIEMKEIVHNIMN
jgi:hypothetical protein